MPRRKNKKHKSPDSLVSSRKSKGIKCCWNTISKGAIKWMKLKRQWGQISYILLGNCRSFGSYSEFNRKPKEVWAECWWDLNYALKRLSRYSCVENKLYWSREARENGSNPYYSSNVLCSGKSQGSEKWLDSGYSLRAGPVRFADVFSTRGEQQKLSMTIPFWPEKLVEWSIYLLIRSRPCCEGRNISVQCWGF